MDDDLFWPLNLGIGTFAAFYFGTAIFAGNWITAFVPALMAWVAFILGFRRDLLTAAGVLILLSSGLKFAGFLTVAAGYLR